MVDRHPRPREERDAEQRGQLKPGDTIIEATSGNTGVALAAVARGDADAGIVYLTDARATAGVDTVEIPAADNAEASYPIAVVNTTANRGLAAAFVDLVSGPAGRAALVAEGFIAP